MHVYKLKLKTACSPWMHVACKGYVACGMYVYMCWMYVMHKVDACSKACAAIWCRLDATPHTLVVSVSEFSSWATVCLRACNVVVCCMLW